MEFFDCIQDILEHPRFLRLRLLPHHGRENTVYDHSLATARFAYGFARRLGLSEEERRAVTRAALLHDFFGYDWHSLAYRRFRKQHRGVRRFSHMHGFIHGEIAAKRAAVCFELSERQREAIALHMFPLCHHFPQYKETWIVTVADKAVALREMGRWVKENCGGCSHKKSCRPPRHHTQQG